MSMQISTQGRIDPDVQITLGVDNVTSARQLNKQLFGVKSSVPNKLSRALRQLVGAVPRARRRAKLVEEHGVAWAQRLVPLR